MKHRLIALSFWMAVTAMAQVPGLMTYQGRVTVSGTGFTGQGQFKFALVSTTGTTTYWSNDGTSSAGAEPTAAVSLSVSNGVYSVLLGDTALTNMTTVPASVFTNADVRLRVWFNDGVNGWQQLAPDQRMASVGYSLMAAGVGDGSITSTKLASGLTLGGTATLSGGMSLPATSSSTTGTISQGGNPLLHTYGTGSLFLGSGAGNFTLTGTGNTGVGFQSLPANTSGRFNTALGHSALLSNTTGEANTALGYGTLKLNTTSVHNTAVGLYALNKNTASYNSAFGSGSLENNTTGTSNVAFGEGALYANTTGYNNSAFGRGALYFNSTGPSNTAIGNQALYYNTAANNVAVGNQALFNNTSGSLNTAVGNTALASNTTGNNNTAFGLDALYTNQTASDSTAIGYRALQFNTAANNTAVGSQALYNNTSGQINSAIGVQALYSNTTGNTNVAVGGSALYSNTTGSNNSAHGYQALYSSAGASGNAAFSYSSLYSNTTGNFNAAFGYETLFSNTTGDNNVAIGTNALRANTVGSNNIAIGGNAGSNQTTGSNNIVIGHSGVAAEASTTRIGTQGTQTRAFIAGVSGITSSGGAQVFVNSSGQLGTTTSSRRFKHDIVDIGTASEAILRLRPVSFRYKTELDPNQLPQFGLIAEEVAEIDPLLVVRDEHGGIQSVRYEQVNAMLLNEFLKDHQRAEKRDAEVEAMKKRLQELEARDEAHAQHERELQERLQKLEEALSRSSNSPEAKL